MFGEIFHLGCVSCGADCEGGLPVCTDCISKLKTFEHLCQTCGYPTHVPSKVCGKCLKDRAWDKIFINYRYFGGIKQLIREIKFAYRIRGLGSVTGLVALPDKMDYDLIVSVPSHFSRKLRRFAHPADILGRFISIKSGIKFTNALVRTRKTEYQYKLKKQNRIKNVKNAFLCNTDVSGLKILLVDDIITTGSTVSECCKVLKKAGAGKVDVFALCGNPH